MMGKYKTRGQVLILVALAMLVLLGLTGLALDSGNAFSDRRHAQAAADAAAYAGALRYAQGMDDWSTLAQERSVSNGYEDVVNSQVVITSKNASSYCNQEAKHPEGLAVTVEITHPVDTWFARLFGMDQFVNHVSSTARGCRGFRAPIAFGNSVVALSKTACKAFNSHGTSNLELTGGGVFVNSECSTALYQNGSGKVCSPSFTTVGGYWAGNYYMLSDVGCDTPATGSDIQVGGSHYDTSWLDLIPEPVCSTDGKKTGSLVTPGNISANLLEHGATLEPGIYCITGDAKINAGDSLIGPGVLLYFIDGGIDINGGATVQLSAGYDDQNGEDYNGLLMYTEITNHTEFTINGDSNSTFTGAILLPGSHVRLLGTGDADGFKAQIISDTNEWGGTGEGFITYEDPLNLDPYRPPDVELTE